MVQSVDRQIADDGDRDVIISEVGLHWYLTAETTVNGHSKLAHALAGAHAAGASNCDSPRS